MLTLRADVNSDSQQISLFDAWLDPTNRDHSRTLEVYDALPKFSLGRERESTKNLREWNNVAIGNNRVVRVTMSAAILKTSALPGDPDGEVQGRVIFPGVREELVEKALRKMAVQRQIESREGLDELGNRIIFVDFTLFQLRAELSEAGHDFNTKQLREALAVLEGCRYSVEGLDQDWLIGKSFPLLYIEYRRKRTDNDGQQSFYRATFPAPASRAILSGAWHPINYGRLMQLRTPLARWIAERINLAYRQAEKNASLKRRGYYLYLSRVLAESGIAPEARLRDNAQRVRQALDDLKQTGFLSISDAYLEEPLYAKSANGRGRPTLKDVRWTLYPSNAFAEEIITGNAVMKKLRERLGATPAEHQIPALDSSQ